MSRKGKFVETESTSVASWDLGVGAEIKCKQAGRNFLADGNVLVKIPHLVKFAKNRWIVYLKRVNCMPCKLLINKAFFFFLNFSSSGRRGAYGNYRHPSLLSMPRD